MIEKYFTPAQHALIQSRRAAAGEELLREKQEDWATLIAEVRAKWKPAPIPPHHKCKLSPPAGPTCSAKPPRTTPRSNNLSAVSGENKATF